MPLMADRVKETTTTTGTGTLTLGGAATGFQSFTTAFGNGASVYYVIAGGAEWEIGIGTTGAGTLTRDQVIQSTNADALVDLSAGTKDVFCAYVADRAVTTSDAATLTNKTIDSITNSVGADHLHLKVKATENLAKGDILKATGWNSGENAVEVAKVSSASDVAFAIAYQAINNGDLGAAINTGVISGLNTNAYAVGTILYPNTTGGLTSSQPSSGTYQAVAFVLRQGTSNGVLYVEFTAPEPVTAFTNTANTVVARDGSGNFAAGTITAALTGNASTASALTPGATINGTTFTGASPITITANTTNTLTLGSGLTGTSFNGSTAVTATVDATNASTASKIVSRDANGSSSFKDIKLDGTSSGTVTVQPAATAGTWSLTLPTSGGTNGHVLTTNGSGVTSWAAASGSITVNNETTTNATRYPIFYSGTGATSTVGIDTGWTFNPATNAMILPGSLSLNGSVSLNGYTLNCATASIRYPIMEKTLEAYTTAVISGGTLTLDLNLHLVHRVSRNANITTLALSNLPITNYAYSFTLIFDANGSSYTITWPAAVKWPGGTAPTITTTNGRSDMFVFYTNNAGTTWYAMTAAQNFVTS